MSNVNNNDLVQSTKFSKDIVVRKSEDRGHANHGWLDSYHSFSFANYYDPKFEGFGCLRVINEDTVTAGNGFPTHPHREFEIFSYLVSGELTHTDSMKNKEVLKRGDVQFTSAGTGIAHAEYNYHPSKPVRFLQIWVKPNVKNLKPSYTTMKFSEKDKMNNLVKIIGPEESRDHIHIHNNIHMFASILEKGKKVEYSLKEKRGYLQLIKNGGSLLVNGISLNEGDAIFIHSNEHKLIIEGTSEQVSEFLLFDLE